jgi:methyl-accepting chemotaxis protein
MAQITRNTREQDADFGQLQRAIEQLERMADENTALLDRSAASEGGSFSGVSEQRAKTRPV